MRRVEHLLISLALATAAAAQAPLSANAAQTARQALLEMLFSKTPGTFTKHLPSVTLNTLETSGAFASLQQYASLAGQLQSKEKGIETFETGRILLTVDDPQSGNKFEVNVENDALQGDEDNIELSFQSYKDNQPQRLPFLPRMTAVMKSESGVWKLSEILITVRVPLADPDFLKSVADGIKARASAPTVMQPQTQSPSVTFGNDSSVIAAMRTILTAENTYSNTYRSAGYTCTLSDLDGFGGGERNEHQAMLISSGLAGGRRFGYTFALSGCNGAPATTFHLSAAPVGSNSFGKRGFCADQSGAIRYSTDGNETTCLASGLPLP